MGALKVFVPGTGWVVVGNDGVAGSTGAGVPVGGAVGQVLTKNSATNYDTTWAGGTLVHGVVAQKNVNQSIAATVWVDVLFQVNDYDATGDMHSTSSNTARFYCRRSGLYQCSGYVSYSESSQPRYVKFVKNGADVGGRTHVGPGSAELGLSRAFYLVAGDWIALATYSVNASTVIGAVNNESNAIFSMVEFR
jgi:hypothetical protein